MSILGIAKTICIVACEAYVGAKVLSKYCDYRIDKADIYVEGQTLFIKIFSEEIPFENIETFLDSKDGHYYCLCIKGTNLDKESKKIASVFHKFVLKNVNYDELKKRKMYIEKGEKYSKYVVEIPLDKVKKVSVKHKKRASAKC